MNPVLEWYLLVVCQKLNADLILSQGKSLEFTTRSDSLSRRQVKKATCCPATPKFQATTVCTKTWNYMKGGCSFVRVNLLPNNKDMGKWPQVVLVEV